MADPNKIFYNIQWLNPKPDIHIGYHTIPNFLHRILDIRNYHNFSIKKNRIFTWEHFSYPFLCAEEMIRLNAFKSLKKQVEWMAGRYIIKRMVQHFFQKKMDLRQITIDYQVQGAPFIKNSPDIAISISHSGDIASAAISTAYGTALGLDLEKIKKAPTKAFMELAFTAGEREAMGEKPEDIFRAWTLKEAYLKYIKKGFHESLHRVEVLDNHVYHNKIRQELFIFSSRLEDAYMLSAIHDPLMPIADS